MRRESPSDQYWGLLYDQPVRVPETVSYTKLWREVRRRMVGSFPPSLLKLHDLLQMRLNHVGG